MVDTMAGWEVVGPPRGLFYNGPNVRGSKRWGEAQLPIARSTPAKGPSSEESQHAEPKKEGGGTGTSKEKRVFLSESHPETVTTLPRTDRTCE